MKVPRPQGKIYPTDDGFRARITDCIASTSSPAR